MVGLGRDATESRIGKGGVSHHRRKRTGTSFTCYDKDGKRITDLALIPRF